MRALLAALISSFGFYLAVQVIVLFDLDEEMGMIVFVLFATIGFNVVLYFAAVHYLAGRKKKPEGVKNIKI